MFKDFDDLDIEVQKAIKGNYNIVDKKYRDSIKNNICYLCDLTYGVVGHHLLKGAMRGNKAKYCFIIPLCFECHTNGKKNVHNTNDGLFDKFETDQREVAYYMYRIYGEKK